MTSIEPGIYRIVNVKRKTAIAVSADNTSTIVGWETNHPGQQWIVRRSKGKYRISDSVHGRYITVDSEKEDANVGLGNHPTLWEIIPAKELTWSFKLPERDLLIDINGSGNGVGMRLKDTSRNYDDSRWRLERLGDLPNDEPKQDLFGTTEKDRIIVQMAEQLAQQGKQLVELVSQLADQNQRNSDQNQRITDQNQRIADQEGEIYTLKRQIEEKSQQLEQANKEVKDLLARVGQGQDPPYHGRTAGTTSSSTAGAEPGEIILLRNEVDRLKSRMNILMQALTI